MNLRLVALRVHAHPRVVERLNERVEFEVKWARNQMRLREQMDAERERDLERFD